jgi:hypothetical protein
MRKTLFLLSLFLLVATPVLAAGWEETFYPQQEGLAVTATQHEGIDFAADRVEMVQEKASPGLFSRIGGFAVSSVQKVVETPVKLFGLIVGRKEKTEEVSIEVPREKQTSTQQVSTLDLNNVPNFQLDYDPYPGYTWFEKNKGMQLANTPIEEQTADESSTPRRRGLGNAMLKAQILLQEIVSIDEK